MSRSLLFLEVLADIKGGQRMLLEMLPAFGDCECHVIVPAQGPLSEALEAQGAVCHIVPMAQYTMVSKGARDVLAFVGEIGRLARATARIARECQAELLYANSTRAFAWGTLAAWRARLPIVWHAQNILVDRKTLFLTRALARSTAVRRIIACSSVAAEQYGSSRYSIIELAVELDRYRPSASERAEVREELGIAPDDFVVAHVGDLIPLKGQDLLLSAARLTPEVRYLLVGAARADQPESVEYARALAASAGDNVRFLGQRGDVPRILAAADALAITSTQEAGPRVLVEGFASGLPVVSTPVGMSVDLVISGGNGFLIEQGDVTDLAQRISELAAQPSEARRMGAAARELAVERLGTRRYRARMGAEIDAVLGIHAG